MAVSNKKTLGIGRSFKNELQREIRLTVIKGNVEWNLSD